MTTTPHENESTDSISPSASYPDFSVFLAAHKLLELSGRGSLPNGITRMPQGRTTGNHDDQANSNSRSRKEEADVVSQRNEGSPLGEEEEDLVENRTEGTNHSGNHADRQNLLPAETSMEVEKGENESLGSKEDAMELELEPEPETVEPEVKTEPKAGSSQDSVDEGEGPSESCAVEEASHRGSGRQSCDDSLPSEELEPGGDGDGDGADTAENPALFRPGFGEELACH